ncbi:PQQ-binding-like beta-propeller repeat protein, partial [bacterium]|nr:PQQ-binding-like beta-propeller repeat protein [bacterium]
WEDRVFISGANENENAVFCYSVPTGELLWKGDATNLPGSTGKEVQVFQDTGYAASTMATDGERVFAIFADGNLICFDYDGNRVWGKNMGVPDSIYTFATSLAIYQDLLLLQFDQGVEDDDLSSMIAMNVETGQVVWQQPRPVANSWTSPVIVDTLDGVQLLTSSEPWNISYRPDTGEELWRAKLMGTDLAPSPVYANGLAFFTQPNEAVFAIKVDGRGDVTESHLAWRVDTPAPEISSPICTDKHIFLLASMGLISCHDTETGELVWEHEIEDYFQSSPVLVGEWMYMLAESGKTYRVKAGGEVEIAEEVPFIDEWLKASPAFLDGKIFIRGDKNLYCIGNP